MHNYSDVDMIIGQDLFHAIRMLNIFLGKDKYSPIHIRPPIVWVLSSPLLSTSAFIPTCFKSNFDNVDFASQIKSWYKLEPYGALKQVGLRSTSDRRSWVILESSSFHDISRYSIGRLGADDNINFPNNYYSKSAFRQIQHWKKCTLRPKKMTSTEVTSSPFRLLTLIIINFVSFFAASSGSQAEQSWKIARWILYQIFMELHLITIF